MCTIFGPQFTTEQEDEILRFFKPLPKRQSIADREHHGVILLVGFWCGLYIILVSAASLMSLGPDNPSHDLLHMCTMYFAILSLSLSLSLSPVSVLHYCDFIFAERFFFSIIPGRMFPEELFHVC
jgi:hypothetical protein